MPIMPYTDESDREVNLGKINITKKKKPEVNKKIDDDIIRGVGEAALQKMAPGDFDYYKGKLVRVPTGGAAQPTLGNIVSQVAQSNLKDSLAGEQLKKEVTKMPTAKKKGSSLADFGRGLVEGILGMPESVAGSSSRIPYALGQLPGTLVRSKVGLQTSGEANQLAFKTPGMPQYERGVAAGLDAELAEYSAKEDLKIDKSGRLTLAGALDMLKDPMKARWVKKTYPNLHAEARRIIKQNLGEKILDAKETKNEEVALNTPDNIMDTTW